MRLQKNSYAIQINSAQHGFSLLEILVSIGVVA
ncbi:MAG: prepilin-type N-terminal cleavage/methylation domain-containing protein [Comamonas sp.]|nr:prepilin-type N-terminal cleavage/methylation domain-containing protein [Comamonas sp.]